MTTTVNLRKVLHRKSLEMLTALGVSTGAGTFLVSDKSGIIDHQPIFCIVNASSIWRYDADEDGWLQLPNSGIAGVAGAGIAADVSTYGAMGGTFTQTATAGGAASITTNKTVVKSLAGNRIRVIAGTGVGFDGTVVSNTIGANSVLTISGGTFDATTQFVVYSGSLWYFNPGTAAVGFAVYDIATNAWTQKAVTNLPTSFGTDAQLVCTAGKLNAWNSGAATAGAATTITRSTANWAVNQWANYQVRITAGTGIGQVRQVASNTATVVTVSSAWTVNPDATSVFQFEGSEDAFYLIGNAAVTMYKYSVTGNTWTVLAPTAARSGAPGAGASLNWIEQASSWVFASDGSVKNLIASGTILKQPGRYLFSFRGLATNTLDIYDIAANTWISAVTYGNQNETFTTGTASVDHKGAIYLQKDATGRIYKFDIEEFYMKPLGTITVPQSTTAVGNKMTVLTYKDGATEIDFLYTAAHSRSEFFRMLLV